MRPVLPLVFVALSLPLLLSPAAGALAARVTDGTEVICLSLDDVPLIRKINQTDDDVFTKRTALDTALSKFETDCKAYMANPQQEGALKDAISQDTSSLPPLSEAFNAAADQLAALELKAWKAMGRIGETDCQKRLSSEQMTLTKQKDSFSQRASLACSSRSSRAASLAKLGNQDTQDAILDPKTHQTQSQALLDQAKAYGATLNPPVDPTGGNSQDYICGESCVSLLRTQDAANKFGVDSWQYQAAVATAQTTKRGIYGYLN